MGGSGNFGLPCRAAIVRSQLKHKYLTNTICLKMGSEELLQSMLYEEEGIRRERRIRFLIEELLELLCRQNDGFSPAQLLDRLEPFTLESPEKLQYLKNRVQERFAREFELAERIASLQAKSGCFLNA